MGGTTILLMLKNLPENLGGIGKFTFAFGRIIESSDMKKFFGLWQIVVVVALYINYYISQDFLCLNYLYGG